tara:strand:+ start:2413 stop:4464 length:2052 start_codon:yes stop_codon:yes gene_type:complete
MIKNKSLEKIPVYNDMRPDIKSNSRDVESISINSDVENALFGETLPARSFFSRAVFSYDVPEIKNLRAEFVYNYFTRDERVRKLLTPEDQLVNLDTDNTSDIMFQVKNDKLPRFVKFSFEPARDPYAKLAKNSTTVIRDNLDKLIIEGAGSSEYHTGLELLDTNLEKTIYQMLSGSFTFINTVTEKDSPASAASKLEKELNENGGLAGESKKLIIESLGTMQPAGMSFARSDVPPDIAQTSSDPISKQTFSLKFNNLFFNDIVKVASRIPDKVFQDEIESLRDISENIQNKINVSIDPFTVSDAEFENSVQAIAVRPLDDVKDSDVLVTNHEVTQIGYIIQRIEILPDESAVMLEPIFVDNPVSLYALDKNVRYGGTYVYKVRTVCKVKTLLRDSDIDDPVYDQMAIAEFLMASEGITTSVTCLEHVPPPAPTRVRARLEPRLKKPVLNWQFPLNVQRDIKRFQIFKRMSVQEAFTLVCEYDFDDSIIKTEPVEKADARVLYTLRSPRLEYLDNDYKKGESPIYAIACVDAHGLSSSLSAQIKVTYNHFKNKIDTKVISGEGAPKPYPNLLLEVDAFSDAIKVSGYDRMTVFFDPEYARVVKKVRRNNNARENQNSPENYVEKDQDFLIVNPDKTTYKIQILNIDIQKDQTVDIKIADKSGLPATTTVANISKNNINFEFGIE